MLRPGEAADAMPDWMSWQVALAVGAALALLLLWLGWRLRRLVLAARLAARRRRGAAGETRAVRLLEAAGYRIVADQETAVGWLLVDGEALEFDVRADLVVEKDGARLVAEVKTGGAASPAAPATRRQLLEYAYVFGLDGVLLVDMAEEKIRRVDFPDLVRGPGTRAPRSSRAARS